MNEFVFKGKWYYPERELHTFKDNEVGYPYGLDANLTAILQADISV